MNNETPSEGIPPSLLVMRVDKSPLPGWLRRLPGINLIGPLEQRFSTYVVTKRLDDPTDQEPLRKVVLEGRFPNGDAAFKAAKRLLKEPKNG